MNSELHQRLNEHLRLEFGAAHNYLAMSLWFEVKNLPGFAGWLRRQSAEETAHAHRFINHLLERDLHVDLPEIPKPPSDWSSPQEAVEEVLRAEQNVTTSIEKLYDLAERVSDRASLTLLQWFINEQVEEENMVRTLLGRLELVGNNGVGLLMIDQEVANLSPEAGEGGVVV